MPGTAIEPASITLDIDDTCDVVHGHQQLSLFNVVALSRALILPGASPGDVAVGSN
jgi:hypothetical protein